jgi:hypothetical protein
VSPHELHVESSGAHFAQDSRSGLIVAHNSDWEYAKDARGFSGAHNPCNIVLENVKLAVIPRIKEFAQPAFVAAQIVVAMK